MKNIKIVIQARMGSQRLPGKMLLPINKKPMLLFLLDRLSQIFDKDSIIVATSLKQNDSKIYDLCQDNKYQCFRGSEKDVFSRFKEISKVYNEIDHIVRLTGDNPFINLDLIQNVLSFHLSNNSTFTSTREISDEIVKRYSPKGQSVDVMCVKGFNDIIESDLSYYDREHVIPIFYKKFQYHIFKPKNVERLLSLSIDSFTDYEKTKKIKY